MKTTLRRCLLGLALAGLTATAAQAADKFTVQLKWLPQAQFAGYYVAQAKGFYKEADLDVTITNPAFDGAGQVRLVNIVIGALVALGIAEALIAPAAIVPAVTASAAIFPAVIAPAAILSAHIRAAMVLPLASFTRQGLRRISSVIRSASRNRRPRPTRMSSCSAACISWRRRRRS